MKMTPVRNLSATFCIAFAVCAGRADAQTSSSSMGGTDTGTSSEVVALQKFIVEETAAQGANSLMQNSRPVDSVFFSDMSVMDIPRSVTVIDPEALKQYGIESFADLDVAGANLTKPYTFGISGAPFIRGEFAGVYIDGMRRLYNADDTPISFGSMESMDIVKGPSPAQYGPTNAGGYVNLIPKSPYFDEFRGSVDFNYSSYNSFRTQADVGGPQLLDGYPMAYRISITDQQADSYYNAVKDNYVSIYASMKIKLNDCREDYNRVGIFQLPQQRERRVEQGHAG
jgi:outer membrane receptor protein involved in Fe transport